MRSTWARAILCVVALVVAVAVALSVGEPFSLTRAVTDSQSVDYAILFRARLPRVLLGVFAGAGLAVTGTAFQGLLRNPLAEPYVLGVAGGAALGATIALALGANTHGLAPIASAGLTAVAAAGGGFLATLLVYILAASGRSSSARYRGNATSILLAGVVINAIAAAAITFVKTLVRAETAQQLLFWLAGFLDVPTWETLVVIAICVSLGSVALIHQSPQLNLLALGDEQAAHLGVDVKRLERRVFIATSLIVGAVVATCGVIGFVGLLVPHVLKRLVGPDQRLLLPLSLCGGAVTLVACDVFARLTFRWIGTEPPVGAITALIGGPLFLALMAGRIGKNNF